MADQKQASCLVIGSGDGLGGAIARAFAAEGYHAVLTRRPRNEHKLAPLLEQIEAAGGQASALGVDARDEDQMVALFDQIEADIGPLEVVVFNIGANVNFPITETTAQVYRKVWEMAAFAGFLTGREAAKRMEPRGRGSILFTGATASVRGGEGFSAFAGAKHALRALAQSMARELGPKNIHVAHLLIDGMIDGDFIRGLVPDAEERVEQDKIMHPDDIAKSFVTVHRQPRSAWTHELDLRPYSERW